MGLFKKKSSSKKVESSCCSNVDELIVKPDSKETEGSCCCGNADEDATKVEPKETEGSSCCRSDDQADVKDDTNSTEGSCCCGSEATAQGDEVAAGKDVAETDGLLIKILGSGCKNCVTLAENVHKALEDMKLQAEIVKVPDFADITAYGVMSTPAMVVNEKVVSYGKVLKPNEVVKILEKLV